MEREELVIKERQKIKNDANNCPYNYPSVLDDIDGFMCDLTGDWYRDPCEKLCEELNYKN